MRGQYSSHRRDRPHPSDGSEWIAVTPARFFLCAGCRAQVVICSCCDRGQIYCADGCAQQARHSAQRAAGRRYQASRRELYDQLKRSRATEREVKGLSEAGELARYRVVHFATHGVLAGQLKRDAEPGLILTPPAEASETDDGYLTASEIAALKLDADWVILSACNTAAGQATDAEALSGLARAFIYAQARALLVSHWEVDSDAAVKLITAAMREIARDKKMGRAEALRRAILELIHSKSAYDAHPSTWAPFVVVGESALGRYIGSGHLL